MRTNGKKVLDFVLSDEGPGDLGQCLSASGARRATLSAGAKAKFLPDSEYARVRTVDFAKMAAAQKAFTERYLAEVR